MCTSMPRHSTNTLNFRCGQEAITISIARRCQTVGATELAKAGELQDTMHLILRFTEKNVLGLNHKQLQ